MKTAQKLQEKEVENAQTISGQAQTISSFEEQEVLMEARIAWFERQ